MVTNQIHWPLLFKEFLSVTNWLEQIFIVTMDIYFSSLSSLTAVCLSQLLNVQFHIRAAISSGRLKGFPQSSQV